MESKSRILLRVSEFLFGDSSYLRLLELNKTIRNDLKRELIGELLIKRKQRKITFKDHWKLHYIMIPEKYKVNFKKNNLRESH